MIGLECVVPNMNVVAALRDEKLLSVGAGDNTLRLLPPLNVKRDEIDVALTSIEKACATLRDKKGE